ncbi:MAG: ligase-associated DNA damage response endonuclease PdeM [Rhodospirillaceae bacterium]|nr:ligase-associated DNA damage response endonuclease PdeM [Rhodospirillaceae bacterium]
MSESSGHRFHLNGAELVAEPDGCLWWPARGLLAVADLHLEKGSAGAVRGQLLPPYDSRETLLRLARTVGRLRPRRIVCLGDSFHDLGGASRLGEEERAALHALMAGCHWVWVLGNHDPAPPRGLAGEVVPEWVEGALCFRHEAAACPPRQVAGGEVSGHYHPKITLPGRHGSVRGRCFARAGNRLILPAYGAYAGGLDVFSPPLARLLGRSAEVYVLAGQRVLAVRTDAVRRLAGLDAARALP